MPVITPAYAVAIGRWPFARRAHVPVARSLTFPFPFVAGRGDLTATRP